MQLRKLLAKKLAKGKKVPEATANTPIDQADREESRGLLKDPGEGGPEQLEKVLAGSRGCQSSRLPGWSVAGTESPAKSPKPSRLPISQPKQEGKAPKTTFKITTCLTIWTPCSQHSWCFVRNLSPAQPGCAEPAPTQFQQTPRVGSPAGNYWLAIKKGTGWLDPLPPA